MFKVLVAIEATERLKMGRGCSSEVGLHSSHGDPTSKFAHEKNEIKGLVVNLYSVVSSC